MKRPHLTVLGVGVRVEASFLVLAAAFGGLAFLASGDPRGPLKLALWFPLVTSAVLAHELGHAVCARAFGAPARVTLHGLGGSTRLLEQRAPLGPTARVLVALAGPGVGLALGGLAQLAVMFGGFAPESLALEVLQVAVLVTAGWSLLNLVPAQPFDGGQALAAALRGAAGERGARWARVWSILVALGLGAALALYDPFWSLAGALLAGANAHGLWRETRGLGTPSGEE